MIRNIMDRHTQLQTSKMWIYLYTVSFHFKSFFCCLGAPCQWIIRSKCHFCYLMKASCNLWRLGCIFPHIRRNQFFDEWSLQTLMYWYGNVLYKYFLFCYMIMFHKLHWDVDSEELRILRKFWILMGLPLFTRVNK